MVRTFSRVASRKMRGVRLDHYLIQGGIGISRNQVARLIADGQVLVNDHPSKSGYRIKEGDRVEARFAAPPTLTIRPEPMDLAIVYEDEAIIVIDKPAGVVVHPARGHAEHTLVNGLLYHCRNLPAAETSAVRPGVVHRLDKDTTGLIVFAKTTASLTALGRQVEARTVAREYVGIAWGAFELRHGTIEAPIGRHTLDRTRMAVTPFASRPAATRFDVVEEYGIATRLALRLVTGRTHQIRVHLAHYHHPIVGDPDYGGRSRSLVTDRSQLAVFKTILGLISRQALHAARLRFRHPSTGRELTFESPLPADLDRLITYLRGLDGA